MSFLQDRQESVHDTRRPADLHLPQRLASQPALGKPETVCEPRALAAGRTSQR